MLAVIARCSDGRQGGDDCQDRPSSFLFETASFTSLVAFLESFECVAVWCGEQTGVHDAKREETAESELKNRMPLVFLFRLSSVSEAKKSSGRSLHMFLKKQGHSCLIDTQNTNSCWALSSSGCRRANPTVGLESYRDDSAWTSTCETIYLKCSRKRRLGNLKIESEHTHNHEYKCKNTTDFLNLFLLVR